MKRGRNSHAVSIIDNVDQFCPPEPCGLKSRVIGGNGYNQDSILYEGNEYLEESTDSNAWIGKNGKTGDNAMIKIDLGCEKILNGFYLRNFHSGENWKDGTKQFKVTFCDSASSVTSVSSVSEGCQDRIFQLNSISKINSEKTVFFPLDPVLSVRKIAIRILTFFGQRGGLHYFRENEKPNPGSSYQGSPIRV